MTDFVRTYHYKLDDGVNEGKLRALNALYAEWQRCLPLFNQALLSLWQDTGSMPKKLNYNQLPYRISTSLPTNTQTAMLHAIISQHASWNSNVANRFAKTIAQLKPGPLAKLLIAHGLLDKDAAEHDKVAAIEAFKHQLFWLNRYAAWFLPYDKQCALLQQVKEQYSQKFNATAQGTKLRSNTAAAGVVSDVNVNANAKTKSPSKNQPPEQITVLASRLVRRYIEGYCKRFKRPSVNNLPLAITQLTGTFDAPLKRGKKLATFFKHWLRLSTLNPKERIDLPFLANVYAEQQSLLRNGMRAKSMTLLKKNGTYYLNVYYSYEVEVNDSSHVLAIDLGLNNLFVTSDGDLEGVGYLKQLMRLDYELQRIVKGLQQAGIVRYGQCRRYRTLVKKIRGFIKTTVDTALKRIMTRRKPREVVVEALSFKNSNLSKRMNRLLHSFGKGFFEKGLTKYEQELGIQIVKVPAAYTSQMCGGCSYVSSKNRAGNVFQCKVCGKRAHADVHAAQNLLKRFQQGDVLHNMKYLPHTAWWSVLFKNHLDTINRLPLSCTRVIGYSRSALSFLAKKRTSDAEYVLTNRNMSLYETALFKLFEQTKNPSSTT